MSKRREFTDLEIAKFRLRQAARRLSVHDLSSRPLETLATVAAAGAAAVAGREGALKWDALWRNASTNLAVAARLKDMVIGLLRRIEKPEASQPERRPRPTPPPEPRAPFEVVPPPAATDLPPCTPPRIEDVKDRPLVQGPPGEPASAARGA